jgi:hypothetical protein
MPIAEIIFGIILLLITAYIIVYVIYPGSGINDILPKMTSINQKRDILMSDSTQQLLLSSSGSTVMGFFNFNAGDRTIKYLNDFTPVLQVENNWALEIAPAPSNKEGSATRLRVKTNDTGSLKEEIIELPPIPKQKWIFIAILRDGRRFDVIYNNTIVASQRLEFYPVVISSPLSIGNKGLDGSAIHIMVNGSRLSPSEVERERLARVDTNNTVLEANSIDMSLPGLKLFAQCPPGLPCESITKPPSNNLVQWISPYA